MKSLKTSIREGLRIRLNDNPYTASPTTWNELRQIIEKRFEELGPGTAEEHIDFNDIDVSRMTTFYDETSNTGIFEKTNFEYIDVSDWDVSSIEDMEWMFSQCYNLQSIGDISEWNISKVEDMNRMFFACKKLESIGDLSNWDISNVKNMFAMFAKSDIKNIPDWYEG